MLHTSPSGYLYFHWHQTITQGRPKSLRGLLEVTQKL